jgi:glutathione peroxidase
MTLGLAGAALAPGAGAASKPAPAHATNGDKPMSRSIHDFRVATIDGDQKSLADYRGKVLLIVNTASRCGFTPQYEPLEVLYQRYRDRGFEILAFPANNFMGQEPGTNAEIKEFCSLKYRTTFPLFQKISVKGKDIAPLYAYLTRESGHPGDISWNFAKFLVAPDGRVIARFDPATDPLDKKIIDRIEPLLAKR